METENQEIFQKKEVPGMFSGKLLPLIMRLALPIWIGMFFELLLNIVDTLFISRIDVTDASLVGGVGITFPIIFIFVAVAGGVQVGVSSLVARSVGKKDHAVLNSVVLTGLVSALVLGVVLTGAGFFIAKPLLAFLTKGKSPGFYQNGLHYLFGLLPGLIPMLLNQVLAGIFNGIGHPKYVMASMLSGIVVNFIADPLFIFVLKLGVLGAAVATVLSGMVSLTVLFTLVFIGKSGLERRLSLKLFRFATLRGILAIGFPMFLAQWAMSFSMIIYNKILIHLNEVAMSAYTFVGRLDQAFIMPCMAISAALVTVVGQNYGRGQVERARKAWRAGLGAAAVIVLVISTLHILLAVPIYRGMTGGNPAIMKYAVMQVRIMELSSVCAAVGICGRGVFQGLGRPLPGVALTLIRTLGFGIICTLLFVFVFHWDVKGVYWGMVVGNVFTSLVTPFWVEAVLTQTAKKHPPLVPGADSAVSGAASAASGLGNSAASGAAKAAASGAAKAAEAAEAAAADLNPESRIECIPVQWESENG